MRRNRPLQPLLPPSIVLFEQALPQELFRRLLRAVRATGGERLKRNYMTTFWLPLDAKPTNVAEESALELFTLVEPCPECVGIEWWLGRLSPGKKLRFHFDRDFTLRKETGQFVHPLKASTLYLNAYRSSPTIILDQVPGPEGEGKVPERPRFRTSIEPVPNNYVVFPGNLLHGVIPKKTQRTRGAGSRATSDLRLSLLVNYWDRRPLPPLGFDYDGSIYAALREGQIEGDEATSGEMR